MQMAAASTSEREEGSPSFFKVVRNPSAPHLSLPNAFVRRYLGKIPKNPTLKTATGEHSWRLDIVKIGENYCFAHGWEKLVKDVPLCIRDIVVFWLIDPFTFQVSFLGANGCEKYLPSNKTNFAEDDDNKDDGQDGEIVGECHDDDEVWSDEDLRFQKVFSGKTHKYYMSLPKKFVAAAGLEHKTSIKLKDHEGKEWIMGILAERYQRTKHRLSAGWLIFCEYHRLSDGDVCFFMFNKEEGVLNLTQVFKSKRPIKQETSMGGVSRNRGRPPCHGGDVKIENDWSPIEKPSVGRGIDGGGGVKVKIGYESGPEMEVVKRKRGRPPLTSCVNVKIEDESVPEVAVVKRKRGRPPLEKPGGSGGAGMEVRIEPGMERVFRSKHVIYF